MFKDRKDAGKKLGEALEEYKDQNVLVLAVPKGGVEIGYHVAKHIKAELSVMITRKLPQPGNPEAGFGAIAEDGSTVMIGSFGHYLSSEEIEKIKEEQIEEIKRRIKVLRNDEPITEIRDRIVIVVDDGIATGSTMAASINMCRNQNAKKIIAAAPVTGKRSASKIDEMVDKLVILEMPPDFQAVAQVYENWYDVPDKEAKNLIEKWNEEKTT